MIVTDLCAELKPDWPAKWLLAALLHDAPEYVIGDMISPFKAALGEAYKSVERGIEQAIHLRFGLPAHLPDTVEKTIKRADRICAYHEAVQIAGFTEAEARKFFGTPRGAAPISIDALDPEASQALYLQRFEEISREQAA